MASISSKNAAECAGDKHLLDQSRLEQAMVTLLTEVFLNDSSNVGTGPDAGSEQRTTH
jgi:hypothetical protein